MDINGLRKLKKSELIRIAKSKDIQLHNNIKKDNLIKLIINSAKSSDAKSKVTRKRSQKREQSITQSPNITSIEQNIHESFKIPIHYQQEENITDGQQNRDLPYGYNTTKLVAIVRDPYWVYLYWDFNNDTNYKIEQECKVKSGDTRPIIRVYDITDIDFNGENSNKQWDTNINLEARNWYLSVGDPDRNYVFDIGLLDSNGNFYLIVRSNIIRTPLDGPSNVIDEKWMSPDFDEIYAASGGYNIGMSSGEVKRRKGAFQEWVTSGMISSPIKALKKKKSDFFLSVDTELIIYGKTKPDALLTIDGSTIPLRHDGSFTLRYFLPDGQRSFPIIAHSFDGDHTACITVEFEKETK